MIPNLAARLKDQGRSGYGELTLNLCRQLYLTYPDLPGNPILYALRNKSEPPDSTAVVPRIIEAARSIEWQPGRLHPGLSWTHYRALMRVPVAQVRAFYEIEAVRQNWKARELGRQIQSSFSSAWRRAATRKA